jgi:hypothetical protein
MNNNAAQKQGYLVITPSEEDDIYTIKESIEENQDENIFSIEEQGTSLIVGILYDEIEEIAQIASDITYNCISLEIYSIAIKYCGKETNSRSSRNTKESYNSVSSNYSGSAAFNSSIRGSFTV